MKKESKKSKYFFRTLFGFLVVFVALLIAFESGYYESRMSNRAVLTKEAMDRVDYSNGITKLGNKISNGISKIMTNGLSGLFEALKGLFW